MGRKLSQIAVASGIFVSDDLQLPLTHTVDPFIFSFSLPPTTIDSPTPRDDKGGCDGIHDKTVLRGSCGCPQNGGRWLCTKSILNLRHRALFGAR